MILLGIVILLIAAYLFYAWYIPRNYRQQDQQREFRK